MAIDDEAGDGHVQQVHTQSRGADDAGDDDETGREMSYKHPGCCKARWLRKRPGAPRWTPKLCRLLERLIEEDETEVETDMGIVVEDTWKILLDCDKSGKDALKHKIKERSGSTSRGGSAKRSGRRRKRPRSGPRGGKGCRRSSSFDSSSFDNISDSGSDSSSTESTNSSGKSSKRKEAADRTGAQASCNSSGLMESDIRKTGDWVNREGPPKSACPDCQGHHWWFDKEKFGCKRRQK